MALLIPPDQFNRELTDRVHPPYWVNPVPSGRYDLVVIGAGTAGLVTAAGAAGLGAKVALVERHLMGGDCLNFGCVPSKAIIRSSRVAAAVRGAGEFGISVVGRTSSSVPPGPGVPSDDGGDHAVSVDFPQVMERMRRLRAGISVHDSAERFRSLGVDVFFGPARFVDSGAAIDVAGLKLQFKKAAICTGARAALPPIPGLTESGVLTNETLFNLTDLPQRLAVIGGGPIGCEMAQCFARLGSRVTIYQQSDRLLSNDDPEAAAILKTAFQRDGIVILANTRVESVQRTGKETTIVSRSTVGWDKVALDRRPTTRDVGPIGGPAPQAAGPTGQGEHRSFDAVLVATGRAPNIEGLDLEAAGVAYDQHGVTVDDRLRTTNRRIYAAGDICSKFKFTHAADFMARIVIQNALFWGRAKASRLIIPWCTYTAPEVAHVGLLPSDAEEQGIAIDTFTQPLDTVDRAILDGETEGFVKVHVRQGTDHIVGATIVAAHAGEMISEVTLAMRNGIGLKGFAATIHPYPTQADALRKIGDQYNKTRLKPWTRKLLKWLISRGR